MHPILFETKYFAIHTIWVFVALGILVTTIATINLSIRNRLKLQFLSDNVWKIFFWGLVGARVASIIENYYLYFESFNKNTFFQIFYIWDKGLEIWGGLLAAGLALAYLCKKKEQSFWKWMDVLVPSVILGLAFGHIGAFFEGINYGHETNLPWGTNFESPAIKYAVPIHPTQFYAFIYSALLGVGLILLNQIKRIREAQRPGILALIGITVYALLRFMEGFVRGDDVLMLATIRVPQATSLVVAILAGLIFYFRYNSRTKSKSKKRK